MAASPVAMVTGDMTHHSGWADRLSASGPAQSRPAGTMKPLLPPLLLWALLTCVSGLEVICYWGSWSHYRTGAGKVTVDDLNANKCTIYIYAFATLNSTTYKVETHDPSLDLTLKGYEKFVGLKKDNPSLKTLIAIGGWTDSRGSKYATMMANATHRATFVQSAVAFVQRHGFDGLDLDYEYPRAADKPHFAVLMTELGLALRLRGLLLTAAVTASRSKLAAGYDVPTIAAALHFILVMSWDLHGAWEPMADHHAPFKARASDAGSGLDLQSVMQEWQKRGAPAAKLVAGVPLYGRSWNVSGASRTPPVAGSGAALAGPYSTQAGSLTYLEICEKVNAGWTVVTDPAGKIGPYAYSGDQWVGYDDVAMVTAKTRWAASQGFGGVTVWDLGQDDVKNTCGGGAWPLITAIKSNAGSYGSGGGTFSCPSPDGYFEDPTDCRQYYDCDGGTATHRTCAAETDWP